ncbi:hypothetical protein Dsin_012585 [Dipteronia sinensis]|uniref:Uncharacterized protein n=1 Tax=Dipteronia sinensis TaxID=43782 RepID=A0AAE0AJ23_9ROSI|nr:hypothetical protein Dsin_012585 [Dipteronia sinensis]
MKIDTHRKISSITGYQIELSEGYQIELSEGYLTLAHDIEVMKPKSPKNIYKGIKSQVHPTSDRNSADPIPLDSPRKEATHGLRQSIHPPPVFGSSPNLEALAIEANKSQDLGGENLYMPMHNFPGEVLGRSPWASSTADEAKILLWTVEGISKEIFGVPSTKKTEIERLVQLLESQNPTPDPTLNLDKVSLIFEVSLGKGLGNFSYVSIIVRWVDAGSLFTAQLESWVPREVENKAGIERFHHFVGFFFQNIDVVKVHHTSDRNSADSIPSDSPRKEASQGLR